MNRAAFLSLSLIVAACGAGAPYAKPVNPVASTIASTNLPAVGQSSFAATVTVTGTAATFQGGDDHLTIYVVNRGRPIDRFVMAAGPWLAEHSFAMGSTRLCDQDPTQEYIQCGPIAAGASVGYTLRSIPNAVGDFTFTFRPFALEGSTLVPISDGSGVEQVLTYREQVTPLNNQIPGYRPDPTPS
jgi:hypothetical protein